MSRWEPDARGRLTQAAFTLYAERGYEQTTVTEIAESAGVTERTFFRYFADKREVLFNGSAELIDMAVRAVESAPAGSAPIDLVGAAVEAAAALLQLRREHARARQALIDANPSLQERELFKMATLSAAVADAVAARGVPPVAATLAAGAGTSVFSAAFARWIADDETRDYPAVVRDSMQELRQLMAAS
ncbi:TetR family transcriptional regulator [Amnibacterium flavum]|uniref:TetR family transcriptional regulator n=1 Tax=Amnibacterium flavum TaxID=2173173 RepID=A0A2V1HSQ3_9MICO|nr:TetR family transcriptional regulator [Amnibacterium flavum]PVZ95598.1 TetR family transcriptional regulator [Amnibacterium flavum]